MGNRDDILKRRKRPWLRTWIHKEPCVVEFVLSLKEIVLAVALGMVISSLLLWWMGF